MGAWLAKTPAVLQAWYPGMEGGNALAGVLFGDVNPSGKLACTFPKQLSDSPAHAMGNYPGKDGTERYEKGCWLGTDGLIQRYRTALSIWLWNVLHTLRLFQFANHSSQGRQGWSDDG
jgi:hypothetical protein